MQKLPEISDNAKLAFEKLFTSDTNLDDYKDDFKGLSEMIGYTEKNFVDFLTKTQESGTLYTDAADALTGYQSYLKATGKEAQLTSLKTKVLSASMEILSTVGWNIVAAIATNVIGNIVEGIDNWIHRVEKANEAMESAIDEHQSAQSELQNINSELEKQNKRINELSSKEKLTYTEKGELEELRNITKELLIQQDIAQRRTEDASKEAAKKTVAAYETQYGSYDITKDALQENLSYDQFPLPNNENDVIANISAYIKARELQEEAQKKYNTALENNEDTKWLADDVLFYVDMASDYNQQIDKNITDLQEKKLALEDEYVKAIEKQKIDDASLTTNETNIIKTYEDIASAIRLIYESTNQSGWNNMEIENIFNSEGIEKTKEELVSIAKAGEITPEMLKSYPKLYDAISKSNLFFESGSSSAQAFCDDINASAIAIDSLDSGFSVGAPIFSLSETQTKAIDDFQSKAKTLGDTLSSLKNGESIVFTDLVQEFPELQGKSENLEQAIQSLIRDSLQELYDLAGEGLPDDLRADLQRIADTAVNMVLPLDKALSSIQGSYNAMTDLKNAMSSGSITSSMLSTISGISAELSDLVANYYAGIASADDLYSALASHYETDLQNYINVLIAKNGTSESFYSSLGLNSAEVTNKLSENYSIDISNCKTYNEAKLEIEKQTLQTVSDMWTKYYNAQTKSFTADMKRLFQEAKNEKASGVSDSDNDFLKSYNEIKEQVKAYEGAIAELDNIAYNGIQANFEATSAKLSTSATNAAMENTQAIKDTIESYISYMEKSLDTGKINYQTYCNSVSDFLKQMYSEEKITAKEYHDYVGQMLEKQKDIYDKVLSAVLRRFDKEIDKINESIDSIEKQNEALKKQKDEYDKILSAIDKVYESQIEDLEKQQGLIQDQIDALNEEADAYDLIRRREDALYAIRRAEEQRTKYVYSGDEKGFIYTIDSDAYREAQDELSGIKREETISALEKEQDKLQESIDLLQQYRDMWANITSAYDEEIAKQLALSMYGKDFEQIILQNRLSDIESFKGNYLLIQHQIDDNSSMIASYNEKIAYYEGLKQQWSALSSAYSESVEDQYAAQILGADWEKLIIDGRLTTLNDFKNEYIKIQQEMADAAWKSTNEQIRAAQEAKKAAEGVPSTTVKISDNTTSKSVKEHGYAVLNTKTKSEVKRGFKTEQEAIAYIESKSGTLQKQLTVTRYKHGGVVTPSAHDDLFDKLAKRIGEHHMVAVRDGERILTPKQNKTYEEMIEFAKSRINTTFPASIRNMDHNKITNINSSSTPIVQEITLNLPNVNNQNAANEIMKALRQLPGDALQYAHRRR